MIGLGRIAVAAVALVLCGACNSIPFTPVERVPLASVDAVAARAGLAAAAPQAGELLTSVVFEYWGHELSALGAVALDPEQGTFRLVCMTAVGVKLFEISGTPESEQTDFAIEGFVDRFGDDKQGVPAIAKDVRAIYLDLVPPIDARVERDATELRFIVGDDDDGIEWVLAGPTLALVEKRVYADGELRSRVRYYEYQRHGGRAYAGGIVLDNETHGYRLIIRLLEGPDSDDPD